MAVVYNVFTVTVQLQFYAYICVYCQPLHTVSVVLKK